MANTPINGSNELRTSSGARSRSPYILLLLWIAWLPLLIPTIIGLFLSHDTLVSFIVSLSGLVLFIGIYLWASWRQTQRLVAALPLAASKAAKWLPFILLTTLSTVLVLINGKAWLILFYFISGYLAGRFSPVKTLQLLGTLILLIVIIGLLQHMDRFVIGQVAFMVCVISIVSFSITRSITASWELHAAREEIARLAVTRERLRIARDLHDLLGHNLSLIALKSELAKRLVNVAPERAAIEIGDVEQVARMTLQEVREAVASYRQPTLSNELQSAQEILAAAGIAYQYKADEHSGGTLPPAIEAVVAWIVREGVTNIIRHSRAHRCLIRMLHHKHEIQVEIIDDGTGAARTSIDQPTGVATDSRGNGLRGLAERVNALGGQLDASPGSDGGFRLLVSLPLTQRDAAAV